jgi:hypothetical protein
LPSVALGGPGSLESVAQAGDASAQGDPLASWKDGPSKKAIVEFVRSTTNRSSPKFVPVEERVATFDQDGTLWVSHWKRIFAFSGLASN